MRPYRLRQHLIEAGAGADLAARGQRRAGEQVAGLRAVDVALQRLRVVQPRTNSIFSRNSCERREHLARAPCSRLRLRPTIPWSGSHCRRTAPPAAPAASLVLLPVASVAPHRERLHPRQRHRDADAAQHGSPRDAIEVHRRIPRLAIMLWRTGRCTHDITRQCPSSSISVLRSDVSARESRETARLSTIASTAADTR